VLPVADAPGLLWAAEPADDPLPICAFASTKLPPAADPEVLAPPVVVDAVEPAAAAPLCRHPVTVISEPACVPDCVAVDDPVEVDCAPTPTASAVESRVPKSTCRFIQPS
jgi:hypothetical protein